MIQKIKFQNTKRNTKLLGDITSRWAMQCVANPTYIIATSGDYFVLYDLKRKKVVEYERFCDVAFK